VSALDGELEHVLVSERKHWLDGPPHELFRQLRAECPVHRTSRIPAYPGEAGYWSVTREENSYSAAG
jgi:hypothetical protein